MRRCRPGGIIRVVWEELSEPWRACAEEAWEAYHRGSLPIGAVVTDAHGDVVSRRRNRIHERCSGPPGAVFGHKLAHAELNALLSLDHRETDPRACVLWTTTEPCPLCVGAARMADVGGLRYAAREPWGGSAAIFGTVPYLKRGTSVWWPRGWAAGGGARRPAGGALPGPAAEILERSCGSTGRRCRRPPKRDEGCTGRVPCGRWATKGPPFRVLVAVCEEITL
jgi:tRNA(Arg) A34 adenosine deaminase TadA